MFDTQDKSVQNNGAASEYRCFDAAPAMFIRVAWFPEELCGARDSGQDFLEAFHSSANCSRIWRMFLPRRT